MRHLRRYLIFLPSLLTGFVGGLYLLWRPLQLTPSVSPLAGFASGLGMALALLAGAWLLERLLPSFRTASKLLEGALKRFRLSLPLALLLAALTAVSEELFFRGMLLSLLGVWGQAVVFALMHPAPRRAWSYTAYTFVAAVALGYLALWTGGLWAPIVAHFCVNFWGFLEIIRQQKREHERLQRLQARFGPPA